MKARKDDVLRAFFWMILSAFGFSTMSLLVKILSDTVSSAHTVFARAAVNFAIVLIIALVSRQKLFPAGRRVLVVRGVLGTFSLICFFYAISVLPLSIATMLNWCTPLFVLLVSRLFLGERVARGILFWVLVALSGLGLLLSPGLSTSMTLTWWGVGVGLIGSVSASFAFVAVRAATATFGANLIVLYFTGIATLLSAPWALMDHHWPDLKTAFLLILMGVAATVGQIGMTKSYGYAKAGIVSTMSLMTTALTTLWSVVVLHEVLSSRQWAGALFMLLGIFVVTLRGYQEKPK